MKADQLDLAANSVVGIWELCPKGTDVADVLQALEDSELLTTEECDLILERIAQS